MRLFEAAYQRLADTSGVVLLLVDDLQWLDATTLAMLHYLWRAALTSHVPIAMVAASRDAARSQAFSDALFRLGGDRCARIGLGPLEDLDGVRLAQRLAPELDKAAAREMWKRAMGSPFWIEVLARGAPDGDLSATVAARLKACTQDGSTLLTMLALAGPSLATQEIAELMGWSPARTIRTIDETHSMGLTINRGGDVTISHDLLRQAAIESLTAKQRQGIHRRLAAHLETSEFNDVRLALSAVGHRLEGGLPVVDAALRICRSDWRRRVGGEGIRLLNVIAQSADRSQDKSKDLSYGVGVLAAELGEPEVAFQQMADLAEMYTDPNQVADVALRASKALMDLSRLEEARRYLNQARIAGSSDPAMEVELASQDANLARVEGHLERSQAAAALAVELSRALDSRGGSSRVRSAQVQALNSAANVAAIADDPVAMLELNRELAEIAARVDERLHIQAVIGGALAHRLLGETAAAERQARRAWNRARLRVLPQATLVSGAMLGAMLFSLGRIDEAALVAEEIDALDQRLTESVPARAFLLILPSLIELETGDWVSAIAAMEEAANSCDVPHYALQGHMERAAAMSRLDPHRFVLDVRHAIEAAVACAEEAGCRRCRTEAGVRGAEALGRIGDRSGGRSLLDGSPSPSPADAHLRWWVEKAGWFTEDPSRDIEMLDALAVAGRAQGLVVEALRVELDAALWLVENDRGRAADRLWSIGGTAERSGASTTRAMAERALRSIGVRTWKRQSGMASPGPLALLTTRELEIAERASRGESNPEIAASLFLSRKTVERHISNILAKLGVRNRTELAALLQGQIIPSDEGAPR